LEKKTASIFTAAEVSHAMQLSQIAWLASSLAYSMKSLLAGWMPFRAGWSNGAIAVDWCHLGTRRFADPFFHQRIARAMSEPFNLAFRQRTSIEPLSQLPQGVPVAGFIFHMSRCGSTLCTQALAALPNAS
jgi:hypothetical protein